METVIRNTYAFMDLAERGALGRGLLNLAEKTAGASWLLEKAPAPAPKSAGRGGAKAILRAFTDHDPEACRALAEILGGEARLAAILGARAGFMDKNNRIMALRNGKIEIYQMDGLLA